MHRSCVAAVLCSLALAVGCGGSSTTPQTDGSAQSDSATGDGAIGQRDGAQQSDGGQQNDGAAQNDGGAPASHTENNGGAMHLPGKNNPLVNCTSCHGADLKGGTGPSCYSCHNNSDHTISRGGQMHLAGTSSSCNACHGPSNTGGIGPSCNGAGCH
jgi:hypothetical protein